MAYHTVENLSYFNVRFVIHRDDFTAWAVLALIVGDLSYVLWQLVNCQARARVNRLPLHGAAGRQHIGWPLVLVVRTCGKES